MKAIVINRRPDPKELTAIQALISNGDIEVFSSVDIPEIVQLSSAAKININEEDKRAINYRTLDFIIAFGEREFDGKSVVERLQFDKSSIWYYHKFRAYFRLRNFIYELECINKAATMFEEVFYYPSEGLLQDGDLPGNVVVFWNDKSSRSKKNISSLFNFSLILSMRGITNLFNRLKLRRYKHLIMDVSKRQVFLDKDSLRPAKGNYVIGYLLDKANDLLIMDEAVQPKLSGTNKINLSRDALFGKGQMRNRHFGEPILLNYAFSASLRVRKRKLANEISESLNDIRTYCHEANERMLIDIYCSLSGATSFYLIKYLAYRKFFKNKNFRSISSTDENSPAIRCILDAARMEGITTIGIQHGTFHDLHPAYIYSKDDKGRYAFPEKNLVWGHFWKRFLQTKGNYPEDSIIVNGQLRSDIIPLLQGSAFNNVDVVTALKTDEKLVVYASQPQRDPTLRKRAAIDVMLATKNQKNGFLLIKLHPNEKNDFDYYRLIAKEVGLSRYHITLSIDLYLLISVCDVLITCFSTVGTETIYFNKPLIILDHLSQDIQNYIKEGVGIPAHNAYELEQKLKGVLDGSIAIDQAAYESYISHYAYKIDGKAADRALNFIRSC